MNKKEFKPLEVIIDYPTKGTKARFWKGDPLPDPPKFWEHVGVYSHSIGNNYNPSTFNIYKTTTGSLRYEIYRDGSFYPYYGPLEIINET